MADQYDTMSREQLLERAQLLSKAKSLQGRQNSGAAPGQPGVAGIGVLPGSSPENPSEASLYGENSLENMGAADRARTAASFGNVEGAKPSIEKGGFKNVQRNKKGDVVAQYGPDGQWYRDAQGITHPVNWLEGHLGGALPTAGMVAGGAAGEGVASVPMAAAGGGAGEALRAKIGQMLGTYKGDIGGSAANEALNSGLAEVGGKVIGAVPIPGLGMNVGQAAKAALEKAVINPYAALRAKLSLGLNPGAVQRMVTRPSEVMAATEGKNVLNVARQGGEELAATNNQMGKMSSDARQAFAEKHGSTPVETSGMVQSIEDVAGRNAPNAYGQSAMDQADRDELASTMQSLDNGTGKTGNAEQSAGSLQRTADYLQSQAKGFYDKTGASKFKTEKAAGASAQLAGKIKDALHKMSPELADADASFSDYASAANLLKGLENPASAESYAGNLFGANKGAYQEAAKKYIPQTYEKLADIGAYKSFGGDKAAQSSFGPSSPLMMRMGLPMMVGTTAGTLGHSPSLGAAVGGGAAALGLASSPAVQKYLLYMEGQALKAGANQALPLGVRALDPSQKLNGWLGQ